MLTTDTLPIIITFLYRYANPLILILGNLGNTLSMVIFSQKYWHKCVSAFYFKVYLIFSSLYLNSTVLSFTFLIGFDINISDFNVFLCKFFYYLPCFVLTFLPTMLIFASIDRLIISAQNIHRRIYHSKYLAYIFISLNALFWLPFTTHVFMKINLRKSESSVEHCSYEPNQFHFAYVYYSLLMSDILFVTILCILCFVSFKTIHRIHKYSDSQLRPIKKRDFQLLRCLFVYNVVYILTNISSTIHAVYTEITRKQSRTESQQVLQNFFGDLFTFIGFIFYASSFFIFFTISKSFRRNFKKLFRNNDRIVLGKKPIDYRRKTVDVSNITHV